MFDCPVVFDKPMNVLVFPRARLDVPHPYADPMVRAMLGGAADQLLVQPPRHEKYAERVRQALRFEPDLSQVSLDRLASRLGMTRRTLSRRLREEGEMLSEPFPSLI